MADDLISRQDAIDLLKKWSDGYDYIETETESAIRDFQHLPSAQPERKHGKWKEWHDHYSAIVFCSECGYDDGLPNYHFCPNCGAEMGDNNG